MTRLVCLSLVLTTGPALAQTREPPVFPDGPARSAPVPVIYLSPIIPPGLKLLNQPAVQAEVGLTAEQKVQVMALNHLWDLQLPRPQLQARGRGRRP